MTLGIRPEHIRVVQQDAEGSIRAKVDLSEMMGSEIHMHVTVDETDVIIRVPTAEMGAAAIRPGKRQLYTVCHTRTAGPFIRCGNGKKSADIANLKKHVRSY